MDEVLFAEMREKIGEPGLFVEAEKNLRRKTMKTYNTLQELVKSVRVKFAKKTEFGWVAKRNENGASHKLSYSFVYSQLDRNKVVAEPFSRKAEGK